MKTEKDMDNNMEHAVDIIVVDAGLQTGSYGNDSKT